MKASKKIFYAFFVFQFILLWNRFGIADQLQAKLRSGDEINLFVVGYEDLKGTFLINSDGTIEIPLVGLLKAGGLTIDEFKQVLTKELYKYVLTNPQIILSALYRVSVLGEVNNPGLYKINGTERVSDLIAMAGGVTEDARLSKAKITRNDQVIVSNLNEVIKRGKFISDVGIHSGDIIYIPKSCWAQWSFKNILVPLSIIATSLLIYDRIK